MSREFGESQQNIDKGQRRLFKKNIPDKFRIVPVFKERRGFTSNTENTQPRSLTIEPGFTYAYRVSRQKLKEKNVINTRSEGWRYYNSKLSSYEEVNFSNLLPNGSLVELLKGKNDLVIVDLMAPTGTLVNLFSQLPRHVKKRGISVGQKDQRTARDKKRDDARGIQHIVGDLTTTKTWRELENKLNGRKADIVIERGYGGLKDLPYHRQFYGYAAQRIWDNLNDHGGILLAELPWDISVKVARSGWVKKLNKNKIQAEHCQLNYAIKLVRNPDSPKELPGM